jgi:hypothetical protein
MPIASVSDAGDGEQRRAAEAARGVLQHAAHGVHGASRQRSGSRPVAITEQNATKIGFRRTRTSHSQDSGCDYS